jgi:hypothetical protein
MKTPFLIAAACMAAVYGCGGPPSGGYSSASADDGGLNADNIAAYVAELRNDPAPLVRHYKNCTVRYTEGSLGTDRSRFSGRVLIHLHNDPLTNAQYFPHFRNAWIFCDSAEVFARDDGRYVYRIFSNGNALYYDDTPAWSPRVGSSSFDMDKDEYTSGGNALNRHMVGSTAARSTGSGHGVGAVKNP